MACGKSNRRLWRSDRSLQLRLTLASPGAGDIAALLTL